MVHVEVIFYAQNNARKMWKSLLLMKSLLHVHHLMYMYIFTVYALHVHLNEL